MDAERRDGEVWWQMQNKKTENNGNWNYWLKVICMNYVDSIFCLFQTDSNKYASYVQINIYGLKSISWEKFRKEMTRK